MSSAAFYNGGVRSAHAYTAPLAEADYAEGLANLSNSNATEVYVNPPERRQRYRNALKATTSSIHPCPLVVFYVIF